MTPKDLLILSENYFESGFNGVPWTLSKEPKTDVFYYHFASIFKSDTFRDELISALNIASNNFPEIAIVDDLSLESEILKHFAPQIQTIPLDESFEPSKDFVKICQDRFGIDDPEMIFALGWAQKIKKPLIFSKWELRILNINFLRSSKIQIGDPYFVFVENEKFHRLAVAQKALNIPMSWNFLKSTPRLFRSYFLDSTLQNWLLKTNINEPHNYVVERILFSTLLHGSASESMPVIHKKKWKLGSWTEAISRGEVVQQASFPLHSLLERQFGCRLNINSLERSIYES